MPVDSSIPLSFAPQNFLKPMMDVQEMQRLQNVNKLSQLELQAAPGQIDQEKQINSLRIDEGRAMIDRNTELARREQAQALAISAKTYAGEILPVMRSSLNLYKDVLKKGGSTEEAARQAQEMYNEGVEEMGAGGLVQKQFLDKAKAAKFNPFVFEARVTQLAQALGDKQKPAEAPKTQEFKVGNKIITKQWDPEKKEWVEVAEGPRSTKGMGGGGTGGAGAGLPKGVVEYVETKTGKHYASGHGLAYELDDAGKWKTINPNELPQRIVKVGSAAAGQGAREAVFTQRMLQAANQATLDIGNIVELPVSVTSGILGRVTNAGTFMDAGKAALANKITPEAEQEYQVMTAGFQRTLAAIEAAGLMPSGTLTHQMDAVIFKPGDTYMTRMHKIAQTRQIVESGLDVMESNPRVSDDEKALIKKIRKDLLKSVPFTHRDLINLQNDKNPKASLRSVITQKISESKKGKATEVAGDGKPKNFSRFWTAQKAKASGKGTAPAPAAQGEDDDDDADTDKE